MINPSPEILAQEFWAGTGLEDAFPRNIEQAITVKLPLALVKLPLLNARTVGRWLERRRIATLLPLDRRDLLGCLIAYRGHGIVFICGSDAPEEQRLTVAHEVAHFLVDYLCPRRQVIQVLGDRIAEVLDGLRTATPVERAAAILSHVRLGAHIHLLPRPGKDEDSEFVVAHAEDRADRLALELVAPRACIHSFLRNLSARKAVLPEEACSALAVYFGLPVYAVDGIAQKISQHHPISFLVDVREAIKRRQ